MACSLLPHGILDDLKDLRCTLFPGTLRDEELGTNYDYDNRWGWDEGEDKDAQEKPTDTVQTNWFNECFHAISPPNGEQMAFARDRYLAVYRMQPLESPSPTKSRNRVMHLTATTSLAGLAIDEKITALSLIPLVSQRKSNEGVIDWSAIVIGFNTGLIRIYTEAGQLILAQRIANEPIQNISCSSFYSSGKRNDLDLDQTDEIMISFQRMIVFIEGFAFYQTIKSARNHLARMRTGDDLVQHVLDIGITLPVQYWKLNSNPTSISNFVSAGLKPTPIYDTFVRQSMTSTSGEVRKNRQLSKHVLSTGIDNTATGYLAFHQAFEDSQTTLAEVTQAVVSTVRNFIPLFGSKKDDNRQPEQNPLPLRTRLAYFDQNREGIAIALSPDRNYAAVSDEFGRVVLVDVRNQLIVRMWKGYRDAQFGWMVVRENESNLDSRKSLLLVIYAPKRGIVEIWRCLKGVRIAAFNVGRHCHLIYNNYSAFGLSQTMKLDPSIAKHFCFLFDRATGQLYTFEVPYVCSLTDQNITMVKENHYLNEFKSALEEEEMEKSLTALHQIHSVEILHAALLHTISAHSTKTILDIADAIKQQLIKKSPELDYSSKLLVQTCSRVCQLCELHQQLEIFNKKCPTIVCDFMQEPPNDIEELSNSLGWKEADVCKCVSLFGLRHSVIKPAASDACLPSLTIQKFIESFAIEQTQAYKNSHGEFVIEDVPIEVKWTAAKGNADYFRVLAKFMFSCIFSNDPALVFKILDRSVIKATSLLRLIFLFWTSSHGFTEHWKNWISISFSVKTIASQLAEVTEEDCLLSASWRTVCGILVASTNLPATVIGAYITKAIVSQMNIEKSVIPKDEVDPEKMYDDEWETLSLDEERLNLLLKQIEDTFMLDLLLKSNKDQANEPSLSLSYLLKSNAGVVSEYVSKWAVKSAIPPNALIAFCDETLDDDTEEALENDLALEACNFNTNLLDEETVKELLRHVRRCFPFSLEPEVLLANCSWEALSLWDKNSTLTNTINLRLSIAYLNTVSSAVLKHNIACLLWKTFVVKKFEILSMLMEKMGKIPKERICLKDLSMSENCLEAFITFTQDLLDLILQNVRAAEFEGLPLFSIDEWWKNRQSSNSQMPLVLLAVNLKIANTALVLEHSHLALIILFVISFQLKAIKPLSLFSNYVRQSLFKELHSSSFESPFNDYTLNDSRLKFLNTVVTSIAQSIPSDEDKCDFGPPMRDLYATANRWFSKTIVLTREWELGVDIIKRTFVYELYVSGHDELADELINSVVDKSTLSNNLIPVAAQRILFIITENSTNPTASGLPPNIAMWLQSQEKEPNVAKSNKKRTEQLLNQILSNLSDDHPKFNNICSLLECIQK